jgi:hypothetical protein
MTTATAQINPYPDVPLPSGAHVSTGWEEWSSDGSARIISGNDRSIKDVRIRTCALQLRTGSISLSDPPAVTIDDGQELSSAEARQVAALLLAAADEIDGWVAR